MVLLLHSAVIERERRAALVSALLLLTLVGSWALGSEMTWFRHVAIAGFWGAALAFFLPLSRPAPIRIGPPAAGEAGRVDERDIIFAREEYEPGSEAFRTYYARHPEKKAVDDRLRRLPALLESGGLYYDPTLARRIRGEFDRLESLTRDVDGPVKTVPNRSGGAGVGASTNVGTNAGTGPSTDPGTETGTDPNTDLKAATGWVKRRVLELGADEVGVAKLDPRYVYSHVGRGPEPWGQPIEPTHPYAIVFTLEMRAEAVAAAPRLPITKETSRNYLRAAEISIRVAGEIRQRGYEARAHIAGSNYQVMAPPLAHAAGLGELGRLGYVISRRFGPRIRLGVVTTNLPLVSDDPVVFGVQDFCAVCRKCALACPSGSIPAGEKSVVRGIEKWPLEVESCLHYWRVAGSDCGLCMRVCPYSHPPTLVHNLVRWALPRSAVARRVSAWGDDWLYGSRSRR